MRTFLLLIVVVFARPAQSQAGTFLAAYSGYHYFKVQASGPMTSANVKATCEAAGYVTPCPGDRSCQFSSDDCVQTGLTACVNPMHDVSYVVCGTVTSQCPAFDGVYSFMEDWGSGSACGVESGSACTNGNNYNNRYAFCARDIDECSSTPCQNGATCQNMMDSFTCQCGPGYNGTLCETVPYADGCLLFSSDAVSYPEASQECQNRGGHLVDVKEAELQRLIADSIPTGSDVSPWTGLKLSPGVMTYTDGSSVSDVDECASNPCQNGGTCINGVNSYHCHCTVGYGGETCQTDLDLCAQIVCPFNWQCKDEGNHFICLAGSTRLLAPYVCSSASCPDGLYCKEEGPTSFSCRAGSQLCWQCGCPCGAFQIIAIGQEYLTTVGTWRFIKVQASGQMTNANVKATCEAAGMRYPCIRSGRAGCTYQWASGCITYDDAGVDCVTLAVLSANLCGDTNFLYCQPLDETFVYISGWINDGSAWGVDYETHTNNLQGATYNNKYALCAEIDECSSAPCQNGATCQDGVNSFICQCAPGYTGTLCETVPYADGCLLFSTDAVSYPEASQECQNRGGHLVDVKEAELQRLIADSIPTGSDVSPWIGLKLSPGVMTYADGSSASGQLQWSASEPTTSCDLCAYLDSSDDHRAKTALCTERHNYVCKSDIDECSSNPCQNDGLCNNGVNSYFCHCTVGYGRDNCQTDLDLCAQIVCPFNWQCQDEGNHFICLAGTTRLLEPYVCNSASCPDGLYCKEEGPASFSCRAE
uniref:Fibropellin-1-like n=1 Tax=Branchiostoma floridae TaxID=7739 RepID=C3ZK98_BRAFL|eukprot:XP_002590986.1 hypothetical protein BRAFLDRAFT_69463 [Branchiostoma floridae]